MPNNIKTCQNDTNISPDRIMKQTVETVTPDDTDNTN